MPSIVIGIFAYAIVVLPMKHFSTLAGGFALGVMMIPIAVRTTEEFLRAVPTSLREAAMALGGSKLADYRVHGNSSGSARNYHGHHARLGPGSGRNRTAPFHCIQQPILESRVEPANRISPGYDLYLCDRTI